ncbi:hypothetical protein V6N13_062954 [Hibiscus sabdariffa]|uniref:Uncharacterized protein n=2 Tax=Hibiscus sabdariffa TaxID=183260 RepID=A0ABR2C3W7_9ROSI
MGFAVAMHDALPFANLSAQRRRSVCSHGAHASASSSTRKANMRRRKQRASNDWRLRCDSPGKKKTRKHHDLLTVLFNLFLQTPL